VEVELLHGVSGVRARSHDGWIDGCCGGEWPEIREGWGVVTFSTMVIPVFDSVRASTADTDAE
jgi:hypothetical protein